MNLHSSFAAGAALALLFCAGSVQAQSRFEEDFDDQDKPWQEISVQMPPAPVAENLIPLYVSATATQSFFIDGQSVSLGSDGVIRYTMVSRSDAGASNVSYEGIRCASFEKKLYAFGRPDGSWSRSRRDQWEPIARYSANRQHAALMQDYFCQEKTVAGNAQDIVNRLRRQQSVGPHSMR